MSSNELTRSDTEFVLTCLKNLISATSKIEFFLAVKSIEAAQINAINTGNNVLADVLERVAKVRPEVPPLPSFRCKIETRRIRIGVLLPYAYNLLQEYLDIETNVAELKSLFPENDMNRIVTNDGIMVEVDSRDTALELAQIIPPLYWWTPGKLNAERNNGISFSELSREFMYRVYKYQRLNDPIESCILGEYSKITSEFKDVVGVARGLIHDAKFARISKGKLSNFLYEMPEDSFNLLEQCLGRLRESPFFMCPEMISVMACDLAARLNSHDKDARPLLAFLSILLICEIFKIVPPVSTGYLEHIYQVMYEESFLYVLRRSILDGFGIDMDEAELVRIIASIVSCDLGIDEQRLAGMAELSFGISIFPLLFDIRKFQEAFAKECAGAEALVQ
jgi:hypothetical protein